MSISEYILHTHVTIPIFSSPPPSKSALFQVFFVPIEPLFGYNTHVCNWGCSLEKSAGWDLFLQLDTFNWTLIISFELHSHLFTHLITPWIVLNSI